MVLGWVSSIDWSVVSNILSAIVSLVTVGTLLWGLGAWRREFVEKRRVELAEDLLAAWYAVKDAVAFIRCSYCVGDVSGHDEDENAAQKKTRSESHLRDFVDRYTRQKRAFSRFRTLKHRSLATFGSATEIVFSEIDSICWKMQNAAEYADMYTAHLTSETDLGKRKKLVDKIAGCMDVFWERRGRENEIGEIINRVEEQLKAVLQTTE